MASAAVNPAYKEFRKDGWPYCPQCEEDELYSYLMLGWTKDEPPSVQDCIDAGMECYRCSWKSHGRNIFGGKCWRCNLFFSRPTGEKDYVYCCACRGIIRDEAERERVHNEVEAMHWPELVG